MTESKPPAGATPVGSNGNDEPARIDQIEADIHQTRNAISGDLRTLGERLSPDHLKQDAREMMTDAKHAAKERLQDAKHAAAGSIREAKDEAMDKMSSRVGELRENVRANVRYAERETASFLRENAVPLALIGAGVAWLVKTRRSRDERWEGEYAPRDHGRWRYPEQGDGSGRLGGAAESARDGARQAMETTRELGQRAREQAGSWAAGASGQASGMTEQVRDFAQRQAEEAHGAVRGARDGLSHASARARDLAGRELRQARDLSRRATEDHPLAVAAGAVAAGVCVGLILPETQREGELLGRRRQQLMGEAREAFHDLTYTAKETARDVKNDVSESLR